MSKRVSLPLVDESSRPESVFWLKGFDWGKFVVPNAHWDVGDRQSL